MSTHTAQITLRPGYADDYAALHRLAMLDSAADVPQRPVWLVEVDGVLRAAVSLSDGSSIADPFSPSAALVELLRVHVAAEAARTARAAEVKRPRWQRGRRRPPVYARG
jgi:hypothetical protein